MPTRLLRQRLPAEVRPKHADECQHHDREKSNGCVVHFARARIGSDRAYRNMSDRCTFGKIEEPRPSPSRVLRRFGKIVLGFAVACIPPIAAVFMATL
jgi:hypothetical protein